MNLYLLTSDELSSISAMIAEFRDTFAHNCEDSEGEIKNINKIIKKIDEYLEYYPAQEKKIKDGIDVSNEQDMIMAIKFIENSDASFGIGEYGDITFCANDTVEINGRHESALFVPGPRSEDNSLTYRLCTELNNGVEPVLAMYRKALIEGVIKYYKKEKKYYGEPENKEEEN